MSTKDLKAKEDQLIAELANRVLAATSKNRLQWSLDVDELLRVSLENGHAVLCPCLDDPAVTRFAVFDASDKQLGSVETGHPSLRYDLGDCYRRLRSKLDTNWIDHQSKVNSISAMFGALDAMLGDDVQPETTLPAAEAAEEVVDEQEEEAAPIAEEDDVDELHEEDAEYAFQSDMAEQAEEFGAAAREEAGLEPEEPLASLPGQVAPKLPPPPGAAPSPPRMKKVIRKVRRPQAAAPVAKSRVLDQGK